jgi:thioredoxin reductase (NADPH)
MKEGNKLSVEEIVIIGGGPAGLTAAIYAGRGCLKPLLFEGEFADGQMPGGQLTTTSDIENYPGFDTGIGGFELIQKMREQAIKNETRIISQNVAKLDLTKRPFTITSGNEVYLAKAIILATGATAKRLHIEGEGTYWQKGISACAVCDGALPLFRNKPIVVIGGGDTAAEDALWLTKYASKVIIIIRRDVLRASKILQNKVKNHPKIEIVKNSNAIEAMGNGNLLNGIKIKNNITNEESTIPAAGLFYAIGHKPNTDFLQGQIKLDEAGYIITEEKNTKTNLEGVFACGDVQDSHYRQAIVAAGSGCMAALDAVRYLDQ